MRYILKGILALIIAFFIGACGGGDGGERDSNSSNSSNSSKSGDFTITLDVNETDKTTYWKSDSGIVGDYLNMVRDGKYGHFTIVENRLSYKKTDDTNESDIGRFEITIRGGKVVPITVTINSLYWKNVRCGANHTVALKSDGTIWSCGYNPHGELGDGTTTNKTRLVQEATNSRDWQKIDAGAWSNLAIKKDGTLWAWGHNDLAQVGDGTTDDVLTPKKISNDTNWMDISIRDTHALALKSDGTLWSWGNGLNSLQLRPKQIDGKWKGISAGENFSIAIRDDGTIYSWGSNTLGALGVGDKVDRENPVLIIAQNGLFDDWDTSPFVTVSAGDNHVLAFQQNGVVWGWGNNGFGQLTSNSDGTDEELSPIKIDLAGATFVSSGAEYSMAIYYDGSMRGWGDSQYGTIGSDSWSVNVKLPTQESRKAKDWVWVDAGVVHTSAVDNRGRLWIWGTNEHGQLGDGTLDSKASPIHINGREL